ncbi:thioredoxin family protein [Gorillibacterium sp. sgz5001074]|uniref:thioredoxin family protein n=1 Tax=Gorillibacterium sp. sgz5001074 TaxID=3446695 RepID=UPI003F673B42
MRELTGVEVEAAARRGEVFAVFFHTPTCGTCKLTARMLEAVELLLPGLAFYSCNVNLAPGLVRSWQIRSVPCAGFVRDGGPLELRYRIGGADELYFYYKKLHL